MAPDNEDRECMKLAIEVSRKCRLEKADAPKVGAVARLTDGTIVSAYRGEHVDSYDGKQGLGDHAEYTLLEKKLPNVELPPFRGRFRAWSYPRSVDGLGLGIQAWHCGGCGFSIGHILLS